MAEEQRKFAALITKAFRGDKGGDNASKEQAFAAFAKSVSVETIEDWYGIVSSVEATADDELWKLLQGFERTAKDNIIWARAKTLWRSCKTYVAKAESPSTAADINAPLDDVDAEELEKKYLDEYKIPLHIMLTPDDRLKGRVYREFKTKQHTVVKPEKCRSLFMAHRPEGGKTEEIADGLELRIKDSCTVVIRTHCDYFEGMRIRANLYNWCGNWIVLAQDGKTHVKFSPPHINNDYVDESFRACNLLECSDASRLAWLRRNDQATMAAMVSLMRRGWSQGEALTQAKLEKAVDWRVSRQAQAQEEDEVRYVKPPRPTRPPPRTRPRSNPNNFRKLERRSRTPPRDRHYPREAQDIKPTTRKTGTHHLGKPICKGYNDGRCKVPEHSCPRKQVHCCDFLINGKPCGSRSHNRQYHKGEKQE